MTRLRQRGTTVLELVIALAVVVVLVGTAMGGVGAHRREVARSWARLEASRAASSRLEVLRAETTPLHAGTTAFRPSMRGGEGVQRVREVAPGLQEVEVEVRHAGDDVRVVLVTQLAQEVVP